MSLPSSIVASRLSHLRDNINHAERLSKDLQNYIRVTRNPLEIERYNLDLNHLTVLKEEWEIELYKLETLIAKSEKERADIVKLNLPHRVKSGSKTRHKSYKKVAPNPKMVDK